MVHCTLCLLVFEELPYRGASGPQIACPSCGALELRPGAGSREERLHEHLERFGGDIVFLDAAAAAGTVVHSYSHGGAGPNASSPDDERRPGTLRLCVGRQQTAVLLDAPRSAPWRWLLRVPVEVRGTGANAPTHVLRAVHDTELAPALRAEGFVHSEGAGAFQNEGVYRATWSRSVGNAEAAAAYVHAVGRQPTTVDADAFLRDRSFGDVRKMATFASRLPPGVYVTQLTPWGITLAAPDGRDLGFLDGAGKGRVYVYLVLRRGVGSRQAARRTEAGLVWFEETLGEAWRAQGFDYPRPERPSPLGAGAQRRWAVRLVVSVVAGDGAERRLAWAAENGRLEFDDSV